MNKFKKGDRVRRIDGKCFTSGDAELTVDCVEDGRYVHFVESATWIRSCSITHAYPNPPHKHAELIKAWADGAEIQFFNKVSGEWESAVTLYWSEGVKYRIKPQPEEHPNAEKIAEIESTISQLQQQVKELKHAD